MKDQIMANKWGQDEQNRGIPELDEAGSLEENWQIVDIFVVGLLNYWVMWKLIQYSRTRMPMCRPSMASVIGSNFKKGYTMYVYRRNDNCIVGILQHLHL